ncbi:MAG: uroporphyrinogen-III synthase [Pseudoxanthomonas sp.]
MAFAEPPGWYVISLRPQGGHQALRRAAAAQGAGLIALSPWRIRQRSDDQAREALRLALTASRVLFTSPAAVKAAAALLTLAPTTDQEWIAVGSGTARALHRMRIDRVISPARMDSEGLLALATLQQIDGDRIGLVTAPDGRGVLSETLTQRGAQLLRADVYEREAIQLSRTSLHKLAEMEAPAAVLLSSEGAFRQVLASAPTGILSMLRRLPVVAASVRLQEMAQREGFSDTLRAEGPLPAQLIAAVARRFR